MNSWHKGGPTIRICVVGDSPSDGVYKTGRPDLNPITLLFQKRTTAGNVETNGILFSLKATGGQLCQYLARLCSINPSKIKVRCKAGTDDFYIENNDKTLEAYGVKPGATVLAFDTVDECIKTGFEIPSRKHYQEEEEEKCPIDVAVSSLQDDEEEMLRLAIEASLRDLRPQQPQPDDLFGTFGVAPRALEEQKITAHHKREVPPIQIRTADTDVDEPEKPKTPSTGTDFFEEF